MRLRSPQIRVNIANRFIYQNDDGFLQSAEVTLGEQERASSCTVSVFDPDLKLLNLLLTEFQRVGGIIVPKGLLGEEKKEETSATGTGTPSLTGDPNGYLKQLEQKYGVSDLSGLTPVGRKAYQALSNSNVRAFLDAVAIAELGDNAAAKGGYGYLFGDTGGTETFDPKTLTTHPRKRRSASGFTSSATGRYQTMDFVWDDDTAYGSKGLGLKDFKPISQEILAVGRMIYRGILEEVERGDIEAALNGDGRKGNGASWEWASLEPARYGQGTPGGKKGTFLANFNRLKSVSSKTTTTAPTTPATTSTTALPSASDTLKTLGKDTKTDSAAIDVTQGVRVFVEMGFNDTEMTVYEFLLTDLRGSDRIPHTTTIQGKQVRAIIAKSLKSFAVYRNTTIRQLANQIAAGVGAEVAIADDIDADKVMTVVKRNETNYQALVKAAKTIGLFVRGDTEKIKLEALKTSDKVRFAKKDVLLPGSTWGDTASNDRNITPVQAEKVVTPTTSITPPTTTNSLPTAATELNKLQPTINLNKAGILDLKSAADEKKGVGKGFESTLNILTVLQPDVLTWQPGEIVKPSTGYGEAIDRGYRISQVKHSWAQGAIASTISIYLPVAVVVKQDSTPTQGGAVSGTAAINSPDFDKWDAKWKKAAAKGDVIAGYPVTSGFGPRNTGIPGASTYHRGIDIGCGSNTKLYAICKSGESIDVTYLPNQGSAGNMVRFDYGGYTFEYLHLTSGGSGKYNAGQVIAYSGSTGVGSAAHLHFQMRKKGADKNGLFAAPTGWIQWCLTGQPPG
ncbi:MAG: M23 family metallopeptidase [Cyanomargarita calcarea GSE-NOS-MK-12-04C]|jgi:murein DD-endopeptidase MepM/ murein hydrolase activator NlpD/muramidase (phage lysozyme)|uniref:M23 family metallopeptidase n=1 Tax=Cyanomargarita calcarea GSE-NOS-MK-12-04C TaxID=2839659 RepID=A0A951UQK4_9CYAN|nr:M23 family metallopeptidase [Cyanomargarita calcarea GSE-NOS-MK-12-04C]